MFLKLNTTTIVNTQHIVDAVYRPETQDEDLQPPQTVRSKLTITTTAVNAESIEKHYSNFYFAAASESQYFELYGENADRIWQRLNEMTR